MAFEMNLNPVKHITVGYTGKPGHRTFYIQMEYRDEIISLLCEKQQVQSLAIGVERFVRSLHLRFPELAPISADYSEEEMALREPAEPMFRVGDIGLGYDEDGDHLVIVISELSIDEETGEPDDDGSIIRVWASRKQMMALSRHGSAIVKQGRPLFYDRRNGYKN